MTYRKYTCLQFICVTVVLSLSLSNAIESEMNLPCDYKYSINITDGEHIGENIKFDDVLYGKEHYGMFNRELINNSFVEVDKHIRGCFCLVKPCVRLCCDRGEVALPGGICEKNFTVFEIDLIIFNEIEKVDLFEEFNYVSGKPCQKMVSAEPENSELEKWVLHRNGTVQFDKKLMTNEEYCLRFSGYENTSQIDTILLFCFEPAIADLKYLILPIGMLCSVPFLIMTILVYAILPELRNVHGKSLICYLSGIAVGYCFLSYVQLNGFEYLETSLCKTIAFIVYYSFVSAFFWLSVISFDLWWTLRKMKGVTNLGERKRFWIYSIYAWGSSLFMSCLCAIVDSSSIELMYKPGLGVGTCFLQKNNLTEFLYFFLLVVLIVCVNSIFFILTALKIREVQQEMVKITSKEDSRRSQTDLDNNKEKFGLYLRLCIIMGVTWCMEPISWLISPESYFFYITDILNSIQGLVIFILFVMKRKVIKLIVKRWYIWRGIPYAQRGSSRLSGSSPNNTNITMTSMSAAEKSLINHRD